MSNYRKSMLLIIYIMIVSAKCVWKQIGDDISGEAADDQSGRSVAINDIGNIIAVGAIYNDGAGSSSGHVRVYMFDNTAWVQVGQDINGEALGDWFGYSVAINDIGNIIAVGAIYNDGAGSNSGHVRVYMFDNTAWVQVGEEINGEAAWDQSGWSVALNDIGNIIAVGAVSNDGAGSNSGHVRVYMFDNTVWVQVGQDINGKTTILFNGDSSGWSVAINDIGNIIAVSAIFNDGAGSNSGHVRVYMFDNTAWVQIGQDINGEAAGDYSGYSVAINDIGNIIAVGAIYNDGAGSSRPLSGHVRVYMFDNTAWVQVGQDINGEEAWDQSGWSVALNDIGNIIAVGAIFNDGAGSNSGHVRVYMLDDGAWVQMDKDINGEAAGDQSGWSVALNDIGDIIAIGSPWNDDTRGHVRVYYNKRIGGMGICMMECQKTCQSNSLSGPALTNDIFGDNNEGNKLNTNGAPDGASTIANGNNSPATIDTKDDRGQIKGYSPLTIITIVAVVESVIILGVLLYGIHHYMTKRKVAQQLNEMEIVQNKFNDKKPLQQTEIIS